MTLFHSALVLPLIVAGAALAEPHVTNAQASVSIEKSISSSAAAAASSSAAVKKSALRTNSGVGDQASYVGQRKERIARVLVTLDRVAAVTVQMKPETADRVEPVIVDLAEQAIGLASDDALRSSATDVVLTKLETTVNELVKTMNRYVEPEASL